MQDSAVTLRINNTINRVVVFGEAKTIHSLQIQKGRDT